MAFRTTFVAEFAARTAFQVFVFNDFRLAFEISRIIRIHAEFGNCVSPKGSYVFFECGCDMHHSGISGEYAVCVAYHLCRLVYGQSVGEIEYIARSIILLPSTLSSLPPMMYILLALMLLHIWTMMSVGTILVLCCPPMAKTI